MSDDTDPRLRAFMGMAIASMKKIEACFKHPVKVTLIVRRPGVPGEDMIVSCDYDIPEVIKLLQRRATEQALPDTAVIYEGEQGKRH